MLVWEDAYKIGHSEMDAQHLVIFSLLNQLDININADLSTQCLVDVINSLKSYLAFHLEAEESVMRQVGYPELDVHVEMHRQFVAEIDRLEKLAPITGALHLALKIRSAVLEWLLGHILNVDVRYADFIGEKQRVETDPVVPSFGRSHEGHRFGESLAARNAADQEGPAGQAHHPSVRLPGA